jgi:hypothetical protein
VTVKNVETGVTRTAGTGAFGSISIGQLAVGDYEITVGQEGFVTAKTRASIAGGTSNTVAIVLSVATATQQIEVSERADVINTVNAQAANHGPELDSRSSCRRGRSSRAGDCFPWSRPR